MSLAEGRALSAAEHSHWPARSEAGPGLPSAESTPEESGGAGGLHLTARRHHEPQFGCGAELLGAAGSTRRQG